MLDRWTFLKTCSFTSPTGCKNEKHTEKALDKEMFLPTTVSYLVRSCHYQHHQIQFAINITRKVSINAIAAITISNVTNGKQLMQLK